MTPTDKAQKERFYGTINRWQQAMPGHVGRNATERGVGVEKDADYLPAEAEDLVWQYVLGIYHCTAHDGICLPDAPEHPISPNRMYDIGVLASGMVRLPPDPDIYFELLPVQWRTVGEGAVSIHGRPFDGEVIEELRSIRPSPYKGVKPNAWPFRVDRRDMSQIYVKVPGEGWRSVDSTVPDATEMPFGRSATHAAKCLPSLDGDDGFLSRRQSGAATDEWLDVEEDRRATQSRRNPTERARAAAQDRDATTLSDREEAARTRADVRRTKVDDLGDFSPTIHNVGAG